MAETKQANQGAVASIADTDLVMVVAPGGCYHPISFADLMKAVRSGIQIGGRNLILQSNTEKKTGGSYEYSKLPEIGKSYTLTACISIEAGEIQVVLGLNGGNFFNVLSLTPEACQRKIFSKTITITHTPTYVYVYGAQGKVTCHWVTLTEGNMPAAGWFPAPEDIASSSWGGG